MNLSKLLTLFIATSLVAALLDSESDAAKVKEDIEHLEKLLAEYKKNM